MNHVRNALIALCLLNAGCTLSPKNAPTPSQVAITKSTAAAGATPADLDALRTYIKDGWTTLRRSNHDLLRAAKDPKHASSNGKWPVWVSASEDIDAVRRNLLLSLPQADMAMLELRQLNGPPTEHGILYLPHPYVVPGGRFNEMYGWDSYFIMLGLLRDDQLELALNMTDNLLYEVVHYGSVLNANRSYYLSRSQPPLLSAMVLEIYAHTQDAVWLQAALPVLEKYYRFWMTAPHITATGLSRYYDVGHGPAPEVVSSESGAYERAKMFYKTHVVNDYDVTQFYDAKRDVLTEQFFQGDRSMRESGYDPSNRFGPSNADIVSYDPVCLNTLLYLMEKQIGDIYALLGHVPSQQAWTERANLRAQRINALNWDPQYGMYFDYNVAQKQRRPYAFATTFFPLWAGLATKEQAARIVANLPLFEAPGGLLTSTHVSGSQWDAPFGWAPLNQIAIEGLRRYGYTVEADRISINFLSMVLGDFMHNHAIFEKYDVERRASDVSRGLKFGYTSNEVGFGWTNSAFEILYDALPLAAREGVLKSDGIPIPAHTAPSEHPTP